MTRNEQILRSNPDNRLDFVHRAWSPWIFLRVKARPVLSADPFHYDWCHRGQPRPPTRCGLAAQIYCVTTDSVLAFDVSWPTGNCCTLLRTVKVSRATTERSCSSQRWHARRDHVCHPALRPLPQAPSTRVAAFDTRRTRAMLSALCSSMVLSRPFDGDPGRQLDQCVPSVPEAEGRPGRRLQGCCCCCQ